MPDFDLWSFVAGLGIFLLGISQMESGLKNLAGKSFRHFIRTQTQNPIKAILVGVFITAILQSSSVVSLMVLAFVGAGIIPLRNAIAIILGTNIGTTITGWIVASVGFISNRCICLAFFRYWRNSYYIFEFTRVFL